MGKKKFIDKKNAITFRLVQEDSSSADGTSQNVWQVVSQKQASEKDDESVRHQGQDKYGTFFDEKYVEHDVVQVDKAMQWVPIDAKSRKESELELPCFVSSCEVEEKFRSLNVTSPKADLPANLDPNVADVLAALDDDDYDFNNPENELEDNFMELANGGLEEDDTYKNTFVTEME